MSLAANDYNNLALKKINKFKIPFITNVAQNYEDAAELFYKCGNIHKMDQHYWEAIEAYLNAIKYYKLAKTTANVPSLYKIVAGLYVKLTLTDAAVDTLSKLADWYRDQGEFNNIAKTYVSIAELYESAREYDKMCANYQLAIDYYQLCSDTIIDYGKFQLKLADYYSSLGNNTILAIELYETVAKRYIEHNMLKFQTRKILYKATLCRLASTDVIDATIMLEKYSEIDISFSNVAKEYTLVTNIIDAIKSDSLEQFQAALREYDHLTKLDSWEIKLLGKIKSKYFEENDLA